MQISSEQGNDWRQWLLVTSIPLVQLDDDGQAVRMGSGTMVDHKGRRFLITARHVVELGSKGWAIIVQQHPDGRAEYYKLDSLIYIGEFCRVEQSSCLLDICAVQVSSDLETWYEYRTPRGLFDRRPHHVFDSHQLATPAQDQIYGFSGRVRTELHGPQSFVSEMTVFPGLTHKQSEAEEHHFALPVPHPGHDAFQGSSGSPMCDFSRRLLAIVVGGDIETNSIRGVAIQRVLPGLDFLVAQLAAK
ncbi:MAG: hypothetical protein JNM76_05755 [Betaproteobacteria bacterium]|nr:hypothetical protein [Betaproteobacteria bacterium]